MSSIHVIQRTSGLFAHPGALFSLPLPQHVDSGHRSQSSLTSLSGQQGSWVRRGKLWDAALRQFSLGTVCQAAQLTGWGSLYQRDAKFPLHTHFWCPWGSITTGTTVQTWDNSFKRLTISKLYLLPQGSLWQALWDRWVQKLAVFHFHAGEQLALMRGASQAALLHDYSQVGQRLSILCVFLHEPI